MKKLLIIPLFIFVCQLSLAQTDNKVANSYKAYFENSREIPHLHLNKTSFLKGENLWFQAYVLEQNSQRLHKKTSNLYVSIYDESGKIKDQQLVRIKNGTGYGNIKIDSSFIKNSYYVRASTKWMKNFKEDNSYSQKIKILKNVEDRKEQFTAEKFYDFQLFPEGGHLLTYTYNRIGVLIKDTNGKGIQIKKGIVKDKNQKTIATFSTNQFGIGEVYLLVKKDELVFEAEIDAINTIQKVSPKIEELGIGLNVMNDELQDRFILKIFTNNASLNSLVGKNYSMLLHNTREFQREYFTFSKNKGNTSFYLDKQKLFKGINIITIFNENEEPVLERMIFNDAKAITRNTVDIKVLKVEASDSLKVTLLNNSNEAVKLSASFLPKDSKAYNPTHSIASNFALKPFVKGDIENAYYYFENKNAETLKNLDLLLLTQGWSKYSWEDVYNNPPVMNYNFEKGISMVLTVNSKFSLRKSLNIQSEENDYEAEAILTTNKFKIDTAFFYKDSEFKFSIRDGLNQIKAGPSIMYSSNSLYEEVKFNHLRELKNTATEYTVFPFLGDDYILLEEIKIETKSREEKRRQALREQADLNNYLRRRSGIIARNFGRRRYGSNGRPFSVILGASGVPYYQDPNVVSGGYSSFVGAQMVTIPFYTRNAVNNVPSYNQISYWNPDRQFMEVVLFNEYGEQYLRYGPLPPFKQFYDYKLPVGFAKPKEYYSPSYPSITNKSFMEYGAIWWQPNISIKPNSSQEFTIDHKGKKVFELYLEGINRNGETIVSKKQVKVQQNLKL